MKREVLLATSFLGFITILGLLSGCSPCRVAMSTLPLDLGCESGFKVEDCVTPSCYREVDKCKEPIRWKAECKKDGREYYCEAYPGRPARCSPL